MGAVAGQEQAGARGLVPGEDGVDPGELLPLVGGGGDEVPADDEEVAAVPQPGVPGPRLDGGQIPEVPRRRAHGLQQQPLVQLVRGGEARPPAARRRRAHREALAVRFAERLHDWVQDFRVRVEVQGDVVEDDLARSGARVAVNSPE